MGVYRTLYAFPARTKARKPGELRALAEAVLDAKLVSPPCVYLTGRIDPSPKIWMNDMAFVDETWTPVPLQIGGVDEKTQTVHYTGSSLEALFAALEKHPPKPDACVAFIGFGKNAKLSAFLKKNQFYSGTICLMDLAAAKTFPVYNLYDGDATEHSARRLLTIDGKSGPDRFKGTPFVEILTKHLGAGFKSACTES